MSTQETALIQIPDESIDLLSVSREPKRVLEEAKRAAIALKEVIDNKKKKVVFNGETYLEAEDWLTVARFYGVTARIKSTNFVEFGEVCGFEATAEAYLVSSSQIISIAESMCLNDENNWSKKPLFQLRSMAQTRACSRVLRQVFGWVVVLAGYKPTPAEEMQDVGSTSVNQNIKRPERKKHNDPSTELKDLVTKKEPEENKEAAPRDPDCISEQQGKMLYAISKQCKLSDEEIKSKLRAEFKTKAGEPVEHSRDLQKKDFQRYIDTIDPEFKFHMKASDKDSF